MVDVNAIINRAVATQVSTQVPASNTPTVGASVVQQALHAFKLNGGILSPSQAVPTAADSSKAQTIVQTALAVFKDTSVVAPQSQIFSDQPPVVMYINIPAQSTMTTALATVPSVGSSQTGQTPSAGETILQRVLEQYQAKGPLSYVVNQGPEKVVQAAVVLHAQNPKAFTAPKTPETHTGSVGRLVHWMKGTIPPEDVPKTIVDRAVKAGSQRTPSPIKIGEKVVAQAVKQHQEQQCSFLDHLMGSSSAESQPCPGRAPSPGPAATPSSENDLSNNSTVQKVLLVTLAIGVSLFAVRKLWSLYVKPEEKKADSTGNTMAIVPVKPQVLEPIVEEPKEDILTQQEEQQVEEQKSSVIIEEVKEMKQEEVSTDYMTFKLTPEQVFKLQRFIVLLRQSPELQMAFTRLLHKQLCLQGNKSSDDVKNDHACDGG